MTTAAEQDDVDVRQGEGSQGRARLLIVDDHPINIRALHEVFASQHDVFMALTGEQALAFCRKTPPDLVLLDVLMPEMDGLQVCRALKEAPETAGIPVIFVTGLDDPEAEAACWDAGCVDFITKPINARTVGNRVRAHLTLKRQADLLRRATWIDGLTGVANRRQFDEQLHRDSQHCRRSGGWLSVALVDIDLFKSYNDTYGHLAGDDCLRQIAAAIQRSLLRPMDLVARTDGEEFTCLLPEIALDGARTIAERIESAVRDLHIPHAANEARSVTVSIGIASTIVGATETPEALLQRVEQALRRAKGSGRGRVCSDVEGAKP
ncbi:diguanylate cyclase domain-containing protein [Lysobacter tyrosinilyticus]